MVVKNGSYLSMHGVNNISKYSYFPHLSSESDEIRYTSSGHCGVNIYVFHIQRPMLGRIYYMSANGITLTHTVRRQDILEVKKKTLVNFPRCVTEYRICGLPSFYRPLLDSLFTTLNHFVLKQVWGWMTGLINSQNTLL